MEYTQQLKSLWSIDLKTKRVRPDCSHILQQKLHLFVEWDGAFVCHSCESDTTELRKQFIPADDAVQFLWKKKKVLQQQWSYFFWYQSERSTVMGDGSLNALRWGAVQVFAPCWILLGKTFCRSVGIFCPYRRSTEVLGIL